MNERSRRLVRKAKISYYVDMEMHLRIADVAAQPAKAGSSVSWSPAQI